MQGNPGRFQATNQTAPSAAFSSSLRLFYYPASCGGSGLVYETSWQLYLASAIDSVQDDLDGHGVSLYLAAQRFLHCTVTAE